MRKKRRPCSRLASCEDSGSAPALHDGSMQQPPSSGAAQLSAAVEQRLTVAKPAHTDESLAELFALIESNPCLWKNDSRSFKNLRLKRRLWDRFAGHLQKRFPMLGPFTADNLRYVYSIKRRQYYDELKDKTARTNSGELEYMGRWKFFDCLSFLRVHSEPFRAAVVSPMLHFEKEQLIELEEESDETLLDDGDTSAVEAEESSILPDSILPTADALEVAAKDEPPATPSTSLGYPIITSPPPLKKARASSCGVAAPASSMAVMPLIQTPSDSYSSAVVPRVENVQSLSSPVGGYYDECDQFGNIVANYMRRLSEEDRLEFHCHIMSCTKDFFKCLSRFGVKRRL
ncbi:hypothetical protein V5799_020422 [Amblyomma americanum]|uniref:MADF domain-containing protein n=1 Tax=Amblyomma americanum TaxID=6943 RepID=A0AAQ4EUH7_AMBAM